MALPTIRDKNKKYIIYRDFDTDMLQHPFSNDISANIDEKSVTEALKNLLMTSKGERLFKPNIGANIRELIFENKYSPVINKLIEQRVIDTINSYEPRVILERVDVNSSMDDNNIQIVIYYYIVNSEKLVKTIVFMEKTR